METINLQQILDLNKNKSRTKTINFKGLEIKVKQYIDEVDKVKIAKEAAELYINDDSEKDFSIKDFKDSSIAISTIEAYTNIKLDEIDNYFEVYDIVLQTGLYEEIKKNISKIDLDLLDTKIEDEINSKVREKQNSMEIFLFNSLEGKFYELMSFITENSIENKIADFLKKIENKLPNEKELKKIMQSFKKEFKGLDKDKLGFVNKFLQTFEGKEPLDVEKVIDDAEKILEFGKKSE